MAEKVNPAQSVPAGGHSAPPRASWADLDGAIAALSWAWPGWLPNGLLVMLGATKTLGKSGLTLKLLGNSLCMGQPWPDGSPPPARQGKLLWCESEAGEALNLARAKAEGLPLDRIESPLPGFQQFHLDQPLHMNALEKALADPEIAGGVLDAFGGAHPSRAEKDDRVGALVTNLAYIVQRANKPFVILHHLRKEGVSSDGLRLPRVVTIDDFRGHSGITQACRVLWAIDCPAGDAPGTPRRLGVVASNVAAPPPPVGFEWIGGRVAWCDAPGRREAPLAPRAEAVDAVRAELAAGPVAATEMEALLRALGVAPRTAARLKAEAGVQSVRLSPPDVPVAGWYWRLAPGA